MNRRPLQSFFAHVGFIVSGVSVGAAFLHPGTVVGAGLGWFAIFVLLWQIARRGVSILWGMFLFGFSLAVVGYYWLPFTITNFGGFHPALSSLLFSLFCAVSSLQMVFAGALYRRLRHTILDEYCLSFPLAWLAALVVFPQLFPWRLCHTQLSWMSLSQLAQYIGVQTLDVLMLMWAGAILRLFEALRVREFDNIQRPVIALATAASLIVGYFGANSSERMARTAPSVRIGVVQGNLETSRKGNITYLEANLDVYRRLSKKAIEGGAQFVFWPESVLTSWLPEDIRTVIGERYDPLPNATAPLLFGALTLRERPSAELSQIRKRIGDTEFIENQFEHRYLKFNSVLARDAHGRIVGRFHKQALMPFGEYLPLSDIFPWLRDVSPQSGSFSFGDVPGPIVFPATRTSPLLAVQPLICYEDLVQSVAFQGVRNGAQLLVNLTNDAWYGRSAAPFQHHQIAVWRAIETQRYLVRVTNTGYTAIVDTLGRTVADLPWFSEGILVNSVPLLDDITLATWLGERHNYALIVIAIGFLFIPRRSRFAEAPSSLKISAVYE